MPVKGARAVGQIGGIVLLLDVAHVVQHRGDVAGPAWQHGLEQQAHLGDGQGWRFFPPSGAVPGPGNDARGTRA